MAKEEKELFKKGLDEYPISTLFIENIFMFLWIAFGAFLCWIFLPLVGCIYLAFGLTMVLCVMRILVCKNCYYHGKRCHTGWGKLSAIYCQQGELRHFGCGIGGAIVPNYKHLKWGITVKHCIKRFLANMLMFTIDPEKLRVLNDRVMWKAIGKYSTPLAVSKQFFIHLALPEIMSIIKMDNMTNYHGIIEGLSRLRPVFRINGTVTVGNSGQMSDRTEVFVIISDEKVNSGESKKQVLAISYFACNLEDSSQAFPLTFVDHIDENLLIMANTLKANYPISYADSFAAALTEIHECFLLSGDPEFKILEKEEIIRVEWLS